MKEYVDEFLFYWYEFGFLYFLNGEYVKVVIVFCYGFVINIYIVEMLCGNLYLFLFVVWYDFFGFLDMVEDYYVIYLLLWG